MEKKKAADNPELKMENGKEQDSKSAIPNPQSEIDIFCPSCGYNLRGIDSPRCPECGEALDYDKLTRSQLPWLWRDQLGVVRAYWNTVWAGIRREPRFWADSVGR